MGKIKDVTVTLAEDLETATGITTVVRPSAFTVNTGDLASVPCVVLHGPDVRRKGRNYRIDYTDKEQNEHGVWIREVRKHRSEIELYFRLRLFDKLHGDAMDNVETLIETSGLLDSVDIGTGPDPEVYPVDIREPMADDVVPNFSDLAHYEGVLVVEQLEIRAAEADAEVTELKEAFVNATTKAVVEAQLAE